MYGDAGDDILKGGRGQDILCGDAGDDTLIGGKGKDIFVLAVENGTDKIADFHQGADIIALSNGLSLEELTFLDRDIIVSATGEILASLNNFDTQNFGIEDFIEV